MQLTCPSYELGRSSWFWPNSIDIKNITKNFLELESSYEKDTYWIYIKMFCWVPYKWGLETMKTLGLRRTWKVLCFYLWMCFKLQLYNFIIKPSLCILKFYPRWNLLYKETFIHVVCAPPFSGPAAPHVPLSICVRHLSVGKLSMRPVIPWANYPENAVFARCDRSCHWWLCSYCSGLINLAVVSCAQHCSPIALAP